MNHQKREDQGMYNTPPGLPYPPDIQRNASPSGPTSYNNQRNQAHSNQSSLVSAHLAQMAHVNSQAPVLNQMYQYSQMDEYSHANVSSNFQNQYVYLNPNHIYYPTQIYTNYPPPPPPPVQTQLKIIKTDKIGVIEEKITNPITVQETPTSSIKKEQEVREEKETKKPVPIMVGKRRGGRVLPTGVVKKQRTEVQGQGRSDAWSQYMAEVRRYKEQSCEEERKNRPLVK